MKKTLKVSDPVLFGGVLIANVIDEFNILKNGAVFIDEHGNKYTVKSVSIKSFENGSVEVMFEGPNGIGNVLTQE